MANETLTPDANTRAVAGAVTDDSNAEIRKLRIDDATKGLKVLLVGGMGAGTVTEVDTSGSVTGGPITGTGTISLVNDNATPGNSKYYGTDSGGTKGFFTLPSGSVTSISVVSAHGFSGSVANPTTTPAITLSTSITGILQGDGTSISAITVGTGLSFIAGTLTATGSGGTVTTISVVTANGVSGSVSNPTTTPAITLTLGAITPTSVNSVVISGSSTPTLAVTGTTTVSGANTGDQTITLTSDVTGSGTGSFATTIGANKVTYAKMQAVSTTSKLLGSSSTTTAVQEITLGTGLSLSGTTLSSTASASVYTVNADETVASWMTCAFPYPEVNGTSISTGFWKYGASAGQPPTIRPPMWVDGTSAFSTTGVLNSLKSGAVFDFGDSTTIKFKFVGKITHSTTTGDNAKGIGIFTEITGFNASFNGNITSTTQKRAGFAWYNGNLYGITCDGSNVTTTTLSAYASDVNHMYEMIYVGGTSVTFYIDGVASGSVITTTLPASGNAHFGFQDDIAAGGNTFSQVIWAETV